MGPAEGRRQGLTAEEAYFKELCDQISDEVSFRLDDLLTIYPSPWLPYVLAVLQAILTVKVQGLTKLENQVYQEALAGMRITTMPRSMDPRKGGGSRDSAEI